jgi:hypothetical protein
MPSAGLSLVGFMDQQQAVHHLSKDCVPANPDPAALVEEWRIARRRLGAAIANAGRPDIQPIPATHQNYIRQLSTLPAFQAPKGSLQDVAFQMVEIEPLLVYQFTVDLTRSAHHSGRLNNPSLDELLAYCLPLAPVSEPIQATPGPQSMIVRTRSLNVGSLQQGMFNAETGTYVGMKFGASLPYLCVARHNGRCYLHNGVHRAYGARRAGVTHLPCIMRDVATHAEVGIRTDGLSFPATLLESNNPPTLAHFVQGRAHDVMLRAQSRILHVSWAAYTIPDE